MRQLAVQAGFVVAIGREPRPGLEVTVDARRLPDFTGAEGMAYRIGGSGRVGRRGVAGPPGAFVAESGVAAAVACVGAGRRSSPALNVSHASDSDVGAVRPAGSGSDGR